ncbi:MAG: 23S rRNA (pseudouridine(1915)-N(3))-methyltransferase RlmH [Victivallaceae bacterium]|nr:23S rRNA (pseudouridine(1915)-N(3))-methyltransferase RlmH [Victivallaceae bacterium]
MLIKIVVVGKLKDRSVKSRCDEFAKWLSPYAKLEQLEINDSTPAAESEVILKAISRDRDAEVIVLSEEGRQFTSVEFARRLGAADRKLVFVIGGPDGLTPEVKMRATLLWSLSKLTFTHEMARLLLYEQLFRGVSILHGGGYHREGAQK